MAMGMLRVTRASWIVSRSRPPAVALAVAEALDGELVEMGSAGAKVAAVVLGHADTTLEKALGFVAVLLGAGNAAGGYVVTERMLDMFKSSRKEGAK